MHLDRRLFLAGSVGSALAALLGCGDDASPDARTPGEGGEGEFLGELPFVGEGEVPFGELVGEGLDGRLYTDLARLEPNSLAVPNPLFYVRTRYPDQLVAPATWKVAVGGLVAAPSEVALPELEAMARPMGGVLLECSGNTRRGRFGLMSAADWEGVFLAEVLERLAKKGRGPSEGASAVLVSGFDGHSKPSAGGHSVPGASWVFRLSELEETGAFLATRMNGELLPPDHGSPLRLVVPGWYGCTCIKWVNGIALVGDDEPATAHMKEFASRTHQAGVPELARDFAPAAIDPAAMPVRAERWRTGGEARVRVVGIAWGRFPPLGSLEIRLGDGSFERVARTEVASPEGTWSLWSHVFSRPAPGRQALRLRFAAPGLRTRRLDAGHYDREVEVPPPEA